MGSIWCTWLADVCRAEGCRVKEWSGWQNRSASQGGFTSLMGIVDHHTASPTSSHGAADWQYSTYNADIAPEYNIGIDPDGTVNILAAGGVNSSGKGGPVTISTGVVPQDGANYRLIAVSYGNNGTGETYSSAMIDAGVKVNAALLKRMGMDTGAIVAHKEWCGPGTSTPGRKIDPYGPWQQGGDWGPQQGRIDQFRGLVFNAMVSGPGPTPTPPPFSGTSLIGDPMFCIDPTTNRFWIVAVDWEGEWASPIDEIPQIHWERIGPVNDALNGPLKPVDHNVLQAIYDNRGRPATP